jgi:hypothetical protein
MLAERLGTRSLQGRSPWPRPFERVAITRRRPRAPSAAPPGADRSRAIAQARRRRRDGDARCASCSTRSRWSMPPRRAAPSLRCFGLRRALGRRLRCRADAVGARCEATPDTRQSSALVEGHAHVAGRADARTPGPRRSARPSASGQLLVVSRPAVVQHAGSFGARSPSPSAATRRVPARPGTPASDSVASADGGAVPSSREPHARRRPARRWSRPDVAHACVRARGSP